MFVNERNIVKSCETYFNKNLDNGDRITIRELYSYLNLNAPMGYNPHFDEAFWDKEGFHPYEQSNT